MLFLALNNANIEFIELGKVTSRFYTAVEILSTTSRVELINKQKFVKPAGDKNSETFVIYIAILKVLTPMPIHLFSASQVYDLTLAALQCDKALTKVPIQYANYTNKFSANLVIELPENTVLTSTLSNW